MLNLRTHTIKFHDYSELRLQENRDTTLALLNGNLISNTTQSQKGLSARVFHKGLWGFASTPVISEKSIQTLVDQATSNATFLSSKLPNKRPPLTPQKSEQSVDFSTKRTRVSNKEMVEFIKSIDTFITKNCPNIIARRVVLKNLDMEKTLITSHKSFSYSMIPRSNLYVFLTANSSDGPVEVYDVFGTLGQFEDVFSNQDYVLEGITKLYQHLEKKKEGVYANAGMKECVLDADLAGILAHEAIGHTTEADLVLGGSVAGDYLGESVASPLVSLVDFAHTALETTCPVPLYVDDEGTPGKDTVIIENGVLKNFMHNLESSAHFGHQATGHARAYQFSDEPLIRMRNTAILPGKSLLSDMISSVEDGYYLIKSSNGQADSTSEFMFGVTIGYEIKNGKLGKAIKDTTISGVAFDLLKSVTMVSNEMRWSNGGFCGKKQIIPVGMGGPAVKCLVNIGGR